jgi:hypothetical protein
MVRLKSFGFLLLMATVFMGWQVVEQYDTFAAMLGLPMSPQLSVSDQFIIS